MTIPDEIWRMVCQNLRFNCDVKFHCSPTELHGVIEAVRNNVLEWTLKLEKAGIRGDGLSFTQAETKAAQSMFVTNNYHGPVASVAHGTANISNVSQSNNTATPQEIADAVGSLLKAIAETGNRPTSVEMVVSDLAGAEADLRKGRVPFGKLSKALKILGGAEDIALRAPEVASKLHALWQMLGGS